MKASRGFLKPCFIVAAITAVAAAAAGLIVSGPAAAMWAAIGVAFVSLGFAASVWAIARAEKIDIRLTLMVALLTYTAKVIVYGAALWVVDALDEHAVLPVALGLGAGAVTWLCAQGIWLFRAKTLYVELDGET
ncbi:hypothetical protein [Glycomyces arizonensis]|uniref:hypothetical protein n=1 Tax=Glycomyces arizonensis TaxID=256035 RepID=UPI00047B7BE1|nr:hypothetical protein [Glycomyces arizonensis]